MVLADTHNSPGNPVLRTHALTEEGGMASPALPSNGSPPSYPVCNTTGTDIDRPEVIPISHTAAQSKTAADAVYPVLPGNPGHAGLTGAADTKHPSPTCSEKQVFVSSNQEVALSDTPWFYLASISPSGKANNTVDEHKLRLYASSYTTTANAIDATLHLLQIPTRCAEQLFGCSVGRSEMTGQDPCFNRIESDEEREARLAAFARGVKIADNLAYIVQAPAAAVNALWAQLGKLTQCLPALS